MYCSTSVVVQALVVCFLVASFSELGGCSVVNIVRGKPEYAEITSGPNTINTGLSHVEHESENQQTVPRNISKTFAFGNVSGTSNGRSQNKIVNGKPIKKKQHPSLALVKAYKMTGMYPELMECGGSIINLNYVLTAAHCFVFDENSLASKVEVVLGVHDRQKKNKNNQIYKVTHTLMHPEYDTELKRDNDIALLRLDRPITINDYVKPISLPITGIKNYETAYAQGWGKTCEECNVSNLPLQVTLRVWSNQECAYSRSRIYFDDSRTHICAGGGDDDTCKGDSGGPLFVENKKGHRILIGVVSRGHGCARPEFPGVYTRVESYLDWIAENTEDGDY